MEYDWYIYICKPHPHEPNMDFLGAVIKVVDPSKVFLELLINGCAGVNILYLMYLNICWRPSPHICRHIQTPVWKIHSVIPWTNSKHEPETEFLPQKGKDRSPFPTLLEGINSLFVVGSVWSYTSPIKCWWLVLWYFCHPLYTHEV